MISGLLASVALAISIPPPATGDAPLPSCPLPAAPARAPSAEALAAEAKEEMEARNLARAGALLEGVIRASGNDVTRAWAIRMLADLRRDQEAFAELEALLSTDCIRGDARIHALAWLAYRQGRFADAAALLQPLVRPRHHMLPRWSIVHEDLGDAYARLGRRADAQAQWRIALATDHDPGTGWDRAALERKLAAELDASGGAEPMLPLQRYHDAVSILDLTSLDRTEAGARYDKLVLLKEDENGVAFGIDSWEVDCEEPRARVLSVRSYDRVGTSVRVREEPAPWSCDLPGDPWLPTERRLVCSVDPEAEVGVRRRTNREMLRAYRAGEPVFGDWGGEDAGQADPVPALAPASSGKDARTVDCIAQVEAFIARLAAEGPVAGPTWQVRDWWDERSWSMDEAVRERELDEARIRAAELARSDPAAAEAAQVACVREAVDGEAISGS